jgi:hypothetical protein
MVSAGQVTDGYAAVFFIDENQVAREMRASEFGAFLDGYVGLSDLAETDVRAVLVGLTDDLFVHSLVFFRIWFDEEGRADSSWNLPIEELARQGAKGPDMGAGPIRLVCRSQCPEPHFADELWDPDMTPGKNHFQAIRKAVESNSLKFQKIDPTPENIPVLHVDSDSGDSHDNTSSATGRARLARLIREQRLRIKTLQSAHRDSLADIQRENRLALQSIRNELANLEQKYERQRVNNEQLKRRLAERNEQYLTMQEHLASTHSEKTQRSDTNAGAEQVLLREQLERKQRELELRDDKIVALNQENYDLRHSEPLEDSIMGHLKKQSVFLVAYHPGVGHVTLPYDGIKTYFSNPIAYAAGLCGMNEPAYREWLEHYENPVCQHADGGTNVCGEPIMRVSQPSDFQPGVNDRCEHHQS